MHPKIGCHGNVPQHRWTPSNTISLAHSNPQHKRHLERFSRSTVIFYNGTSLFPLKIDPSHGGSGPPSNMWFVGLTRVINPNGISIGAAVFAGLTSVTDRLTDHATRSVTIGRIYVCSTAMWPKNRG